MHVPSFFSAICCSRLSGVAHHEIHSQAPFLSGQSTCVYIAAKNHLLSFCSIVQE